MINRSREHLLKYGLAGTAALTTLAISPGIGYDPINLPKMLVVVTGSSVLLIPLIMEFKATFAKNKILPLLALALALALAISLITNSAPVGQQLWGMWGRSTGLLTYWAFLILLLTAYTLALKTNVDSIRVAFERLSYFISAYTLAQAGDVDPINWSQRLMVATLGNINFMSSFLGLACCSMFVRVIIDRIPATSKLYYGLFVSLNLYLIWISESIQGIGIFAAGVVVSIAFKIREHFGFLRSLYWLLATIPIGIVAFIGTIGVGPLSILKQDTAVFRLDYWRAGVRMVVAEWINGVGIDSYGDYYEQYRDFDAVVRTGPQRVTNTAHNIFLDVASGSGAIAGLLFVLLFLFTFLKLIRMLQTGHSNSTEVAFASIFVGFFVFCLISINQIGVGVWGFIAIGCLNGANERKRDSTGAASRIKENFVNKGIVNSGKQAKENLSIGALVSISLLGFLGFATSSVPNIIDARMLRAVQILDYDEMRRISVSNLSASYHRNKYQAILVEHGRFSEAYNFAVKEIERDPRNSVSLQIIAYSDSAARDRRIEAIARLKAMDPKNETLLTELRNLESRLS